MTKDEVIRAIDALNRVYMSYTAQKMDTDFITAKIKELVAVL